MEEEPKTDLGMTIMEERITAGIDMVKKKAGEHGIDFTEAVFLQGCQVGISMFIQKESARRMKRK